MRAEDAGARTWLFATLAGWAICVWVLAVFGLGGSIDRLDDDPALQQALPSLARPGAERLGPLPQYGEVGGRPLFTDNRRPQPFVIDPMGETAEASNDFDFVLTSVVRTPDFRLVILQPSNGGMPIRVKQGQAPDAAPGWSLESVEARKAVFSGPQGQRTLELRVFDGVGGEAPTQVAVARPQPDPGALPVPPPASASAQEMAVNPAGQPMVAGDPGQPRAAPGQNGPGAEANAQAQAQTAQDQVEAIRKRIEERRAKLRQDEIATMRANQKK